MEDILSTIRKYQNERGWTDYQFADQAGMPQSTISSWFSKNVIPSVPSLTKVCDAFGITLTQLFAGAGEAVTLTESQRALLARWSRLTENQQEAVFQIIDNMM